MLEKRKDDLTKQFHFRTDRIIDDSGLFFFYTREGTMEGPFKDTTEAGIQLENYIKARLPEQGVTAKPISIGCIELFEVPQPA